MKNHLKHLARSSTVPYPPSAFPMMGKNKTLKCNNQSEAVKAVFISFKSH